MCEFPEVATTKKKKRETKHFVIQAHLHCMKTHKPTYASHHYISFRELTTNNGNTMTMTTNDDDDCDGDDDNGGQQLSRATIFEKSECADWVCCFTSISANVSTRGRTFYNQNIICWLQNQVHKERNTSRMDMLLLIIIVVRFVPWSCALFVRCNAALSLARPVNLIRYFMRPNVSSCDCLFRICFPSTPRSLIVRRMEQFYFMAFAIVSSSSFQLLLRGVSCVHFQSNFMLGNSFFLYAFI